MKNKTMMQYFEWYLPDDGAHWRHCAQEAPKLAESGINMVWLPPAYKGANGIHDVGYAVYDTYDLGEFEQKGSIPTKYGTRAEYIDAIEVFHRNNIQVLADIVLNHRMGADGTETITAVEDADIDRQRQVSPEGRVRVWTRFDFPGRNGKYSDFKWNASHFDGADWDDERKKKAILRFQGKSWDSETDSENGNYDYLMGVDLDMSNPEVNAELIRWGNWYRETASFDGVRLDAVKHIRFTFFAEWLAAIRKNVEGDFFAVGEYWSPDLGHLTHYLDKCSRCMSLFDVPLHFRFFNIAKNRQTADLRHLTEGTLTAANPAYSVAFVDNHDTQPGQALCSFVEPWFKPLAYGFILLRQEGLPCVFYGDYYGIPHDGIAPVRELPVLLKLREWGAYGLQHDYLDEPACIGWTREGEEGKENSGMAVLLSIRGNNRKRMYVGKGFAGMFFYDVTGHCTLPVQIGEDGLSDFYVDEGTISVWVPQAMAVRLGKATP